MPTCIPAPSSRAMFPAGCSILTSLPGGSSSFKNSHPLGSCSQGTDRKGALHQHCRKQSPAGSQGICGAPGPGPAFGSRGSSASCQRAGAEAHTEAPTGHCLWPKGNTPSQRKPTSNDCSILPTKVHSFASIQASLKGYSSFKLPGKQPPGHTFHREE